jgi:hypothetical protein
VTLDRTGGSTMARDKICNLISTKCADRIRAAGFVPIDGVVEACITTTSNYAALLASQPSVSITKTAIKKTQTRYTAENSLISLMALVLDVAATHFTPTTEDISEQEKELERASEGAKKFYKMVQDAYGGNVPLSVVKPQNTLSSDDTVTFAFAGTEKKGAAWRLVEARSLGKAGTNSKYQRDDSGYLNGLRVKITYTFSAAGMVADLFVSICDLTKVELPKDTCPEGILKIKIEGLCVGGAGVTVGSKGHGWLVFVRTDSDKKADQKRYSCYRNNVLLPFIQQSRAKFDGLQEDEAIKDEDQVVSWCNGDLAQIATIVSEESLATYAKNKICANKQNAAHSAVKQPADLTKCFKLFHLLQKAMTVVDIPPDRHPLKKLMLKLFLDLNSTGQLIKFEEATAGVDCLILRAFECRSLAPIVMIQAPPSSEENEDGEIEGVQANNPTIIHV